MRFSVRAPACALVIAGTFAQAVVRGQERVRFEVRSAETAPGPGLTEATVSDSGRRVYVHDAAVVTGQDVTSATVVPSGGVFSVAIRFNAQGAERMAALTQSHAGRPLALIVDGKVITAPTVKGPIGDAALITGQFTREEAERISSGILAR
jgi:preprotein translocase subunit SecD